MAVVAARFDVFLVNLEPTVGSEIHKVRPCVVISPDDFNPFISTVIIAPMSTAGKDYPFRIPCHFEGRDGRILVDQIRTVDKARLLRRLGNLAVGEQEAVLVGLSKLFAI